ncbi:synaptic plasticity regulator PANTS [Trichomycterus rosablanca]|uniref:synaptic plasticity regulator PANTS n=1 Tax=Trichomycterus rosablanca TaxID=2290929 RepID=UPI002F360309
MAGVEVPWRPPRVCDVYWSEFRHCKSLQNCFHHYYTYGKSPVCQQWKEDFEVCKEWERTHSPQAKETLQKSEQSRVSEQRNFTPVWEMRKSPPADWHLPLDQDKTQDP